MNGKMGKVTSEDPRRLVPKKESGNDRPRKDKKLFSPDKETTSPKKTDLRSPKLGDPQFL